VPTAVIKQAAPFAPLSYNKATGKLSRPLEYYFRDVEGTLRENGVTADRDMIAQVIRHSLKDGVRDVCLAEEQAMTDGSWSAGFNTWAEFKDFMYNHYAEHDRKKAASNELHLLKQSRERGSLERYVATSKTLHLIAGDEVGPAEKLRCFMGGLQPALSTLIRGVVAAMDRSSGQMGGAKLPRDFATMSQIALEIGDQRVNERLDDVATFSSGDNPSGGPVMMEFSAMPRRGSGGNPAYGRSGGRFGGGGSGGGQYGGGYSYTNNRYGGGGSSGGGNRSGGGRFGGGGRQGGGRNHAPAPSNRRPDRWTPSLNQAQRQKLRDQGKCFCCKQVADHGWEQCPRNPDNRRSGGG